MYQGHQAHNPGDTGADPTSSDPGPPPGLHMVSWALTPWKQSSAHCAIRMGPPSPHRASLWWSLFWLRVPLQISGAWERPVPLPCHLEHTCRWSWSWALSWPLCPLQAPRFLMTMGYDFPPGEGLAHLVDLQAAWWFNSSPLSLWKFAGLCLSFPRGLGAHFVGETTPSLLILKASVTLHFPSFPQRVTQSCDISTFNHVSLQNRKSVSSFKVYASSVFLRELLCSIPVALIVTESWGSVCLQDNYISLIWCESMRAVIMLYPLLFWNFQFACFKNKRRLPHLKQYYFTRKKNARSPHRVTG